MSKGAVLILGPLLSFTTLSGGGLGQAAMTDIETATDSDWQRQLDRLRTSAVGDLDLASDAAAMEQWRITHLGRKSGLSDLLGGMGKLAPDERKVVGSAANVLKRDLEQAYGERERVIRERELSQTLER